MASSGHPRDPAVVELRRRLEEDIRLLEAALAGLDQRQADWRPGPDRWSIGEVVHHLVISNDYFAGRVARLIERGRSAAGAARLDGRRTWPRLRLIADRAASGPVKNPEGSTPTRGLPITELRERLTASHEAVASQVPAIAGLDVAELTARHPLGFEINLFQWFDAVGAHERRHLSQIEEIVTTAAFPTAEGPHR